MNNSRSLLFISFCALTLFASCDVVNQVSQAKNLAKCDFRLESIQNLNLAGINVQNVNSLSDFTMFDAAKLASAFSSSQVPLDFTLNVEAKNPNTSPAGMTRIDWILLIDDIEMTRGILDKPITIPANNGSAMIPMHINVDLKKALAGKGADAIINFGLNLAGSGNKPSRFTLQMKPTISVAGIPIAYPGYINVKTEYSSNYNLN
jgi:hypothetical protein